MLKFKLSLRMSSHFYKSKSVSKSVRTLPHSKISKNASEFLTHSRKLTHSYVSWSKEGGGRWVNPLFYAYGSNLTKKKTCDTQVFFFHKFFFRRKIFFPEKKIPLIEPISTNTGQFFLARKIDFLASKKIRQNYDF